MLNHCNITYRNQSKVGNATPAQVLSGATFTNASGVGLAGTMTNQGAWKNTPTIQGKVAIPAGYHNGNGYIDTSNVGYRIKTETIQGLVFNAWTEVNIGVRPKILIVNFYWNDSGTVKHYFTACLGDGVVGISGHGADNGIRITDNGFEYRTAEAVVAQANKLVYTACY